MAATSTGPMASTPPVYGRGLVHTFINPQPITKASIIRYNPRIDDPYRGKKEREPAFIPVAAKIGGTAIGTIYAMETPGRSTPPKHYLGKVGISRGVFVDDPSTYRTQTKKEMNYEAILEKLAYDLYQELGRRIFEVPKSYLSPQRIIDDYTRRNRLALFLAGTVDDVQSQGLPAAEATPITELVTNESLRIMSRMIEGYQDFHHGETHDTDGNALSFTAYIEKNHRPPEQLLTPEGRAVPIRGLIGLLAVGRILGDTDVIGGDGGNAGYIWVKDDTQQIIVAQAVKIDPGMAFMFGENDESNWASNTYHQRRGRAVRTLEDLRDLQIAQNYAPLTIQWSSLTVPQKTEFLQVLYNSSRYLNTPEILDYLFYRDGHFNRTATEQNPREKAQQFQRQMERWLTIQLEIYGEELTRFKQEYQTQIICTQHIDQWGEFLLEQQQRAIDTAVRGLLDRLEGTSLAQEAMRQELARVLERSEAPSREAVESRQAQETMRRDLLQRLDQSQQVQESMRRELATSGQTQEAMRRELAQRSEELVQVREESDRKIRELMRRLEVLEARPIVHTISAPVDLSTHPSSFPFGWEGGGTPSPQYFSTLSPIRPPAAASSFPFGWEGGRTTSPQYSPTPPPGHSSAAASSVPSSPLEPRALISPTIVRATAKPALAFGAEDWKRYYGDVGVEPPLPPNIEEILGTPCPFWPSKTIRETHVLVLLPATVNGRALTLDYLGELIQTPKSGGHATKYRDYNGIVKKQEGGKSLGRSQWVLLTRDGIPGTRHRSYSAQKSLLENQVRGMRIMRGGVPTLMEAGVAVLMEHVRTGGRLYGDIPLMHTRCQEVVNGYQAAVGGFAAAGLNVPLYPRNDGVDYCCLACSWKF